MTERDGNVRQNVNLACESIKKPGKRQGNPGSASERTSV